METQGKTDTDSGPNAETDTCSDTEAYTSSDTCADAEANACSNASADAEAYACSYACSNASSNSEAYTCSDTSSDPYACTGKNLVSVQRKLFRLSRVLETGCISICNHERHQQQQGRYGLHQSDCSSDYCACRRAVIITAAWTLSGS